MLKPLAAALAVTLSFAATACTAQQDDDELVFDDDTGKADVVRPVGVYHRELGADDAGLTLLRLNADRTYDASEELVRCDPGDCTIAYAGTYRFASSHGNRYIVLYNDDLEGSPSTTYRYELDGNDLFLAFPGFDEGFTMSRSSDLTLGADDDGGTFEVGEGGNVVLTLPSNATTGYSWQVTETDRTFGYPDEDQASGSESGPVGGGGTTTFTWATLGALSQVGEHHVTLEYRRSWEDASTPPADTYEFTVDVTN
jgi:predicted secreted protein